MSEAPVPAAKVAVFTIVSNNYLHFARTLMQSVAKHQPDWARYVMVLDRPVAEEAVCDSPLYEVLSPGDLDLPKPQEFLFRYTVLEANTAVKPWVFQLLSEQHGYSAVVYLDPDIWIYRPLTHVTRELSGGASLVLIPHMMAPVCDDKRPSETDILVAGTYNLGFAAIGPWTRARNIIEWWATRLERSCVVDPSNGLFVDQKWMDLVPTMFNGVRVLRHKGYNVAYWNLHERPIKKISKEWTADDQALHFFHFSGLDTEKPDALSKHQDRFRLEHLGDGQALVHDYCETLRANGAHSFSSRPYGFAQNDRGEYIPDTIRRLYRSSPDIQEFAGPDPFSADLSVVLNAGIDLSRDRNSPPTRLMRWVWKERSDLQAMFPDPDVNDCEGFARWFVSRSQVEYQFADSVVEPVRQWLLENAEQKGAVVGNFELSTIGRMFKCHDEAFVQRVYHVILGREPDDEGFKQFTDRLRCGKISRSRLARAVAASEEARERGIPLWTRLMLFLPLPLLAGFDRAGSNQGHTEGAAQETSTKNRAKEACRAHALGRLSRLGGDAREPPIRVIGYLGMETGVGESARRFVVAARESGLSVEQWSISENGTITRKAVCSEPDGIGHQNPAFSIMHVNADQLPMLSASLAPTGAQDSYKIGFWHWELPRFPKRFYDAFRHLDEIWVPSQFIVDALLPVSPLPVVKIPHAVEVRDAAVIKRARFGIPEQAFVFLLMYDMRSYQIRKNPVGAINAYIKAFPNRSEHVCLVIKTNNAGVNQEEFESLKSRIESREDIILLNCNLTRDEVYGLEALVDCCVSLHHSEGFGFVPAECMCLGKPVIATGWSGNMEFMNPENSYLVEYSLKELPAAVGPYQAGEYWADPDIEHAAHLMRRVVHDRDERLAKASAAEATMRTYYSPVTVGERYRQRLSTLREHALNLTPRP